jgi:hypothetical protein
MALFTGRVQVVMERIRRWVEKPYVPYLVILLMAMIVHGLLLLNDGIYWDDWVWFDLRNNIYHWDRIFAASAEMGSMPYEKYFGYLFSVFPDRVFASKFFVFVAIVGSGCLFFELCLGSGYFNRWESLLVALVSVVYPADKSQVIMSTAFYFIYSAVFLAACLVALRKERFRHNKPIYVLVRIVSLLLFLVSFSLNSFLVVFYCFVILLFFHYDARVRERPWFIKRTFVFFVRHIDYLLLPILYWFTKKTFFKPFGFYQTYNSIDTKMGLSSFYQAAVQFAKTGVVDQFKIAFELMKAVFARLEVTFMLYGVGVLIMVMTLLAVFKQRTINRSHVSLLLVPLGYGLVLLAGSIFPYIVTGNIVSLYGPYTRHGILLCLPVAILLVALVRLLYHNADSHLSLVGGVILALPLAAFALVFIQSYFHWQIKWIANLSIMQQFSLSDNLQDFSIYRVDDRTNKTKHNDIQQFYEYTGMFYYVTGAERTFGMDYKHMDSNGLGFFTDSGTKFFIEQYSLQDFDPRGCQAQMTISPGPSVRGLPSAGIVARYFSLKFFGDAGELDQFLSQATVITITPFDSPVATNCPTHIP